uniref:Phosphatidylinositol/phosphatidylcholine transfer protein SFH12 isoform X2 n=1 Tax=Nicotiana tabacum TaxID=4097 RepID=A0A1S4CIK2_TOBAC|nr:PREDICTED: phosphatidylinositol/phosphatidylcholine transfer protein SFH12-like isoform X2 [Nicotiana tabacum]
MGDLPCPPYPNQRLEARILSKNKLPKICLVASATKHFSEKTLKCITKVKQSVQTSGAAGDVVVFLATTAALEIVRRLSKCRCPFIWRGLQALQVLCYPPFKWIQKWAPLKALVKQLQMLNSWIRNVDFFPVWLKLSRPMLLLSIATVFSDQSSSTEETTPNDYHDSRAYPQASSHDEVLDDDYPERWLLELHRELREEGISVPERLNDDELRQFYAAANGDFSRLLSSVKKTIKWRQSYTILSPEELEACSQFIFWHGHDANQRPCLIIRLGLACSNLKSRDRLLVVKAVVSQIEHGILSLVDVRHPQITVLMDCEGLSPLGFPIHTMRSCAMLLQDHYPNRLSSLIVVRLPQVAQIIMQAFFKVLKPATRQKVRIIGRNHLEFLSKNLDSIPSFLGGSCVCSKCSDGSNVEGKSDEVTLAEPTPDRVDRSDEVSRTEPTPDHVNKSDEVTWTEPTPDHVNESPKLDHNNVSNTNGNREELMKTLIIGILLVCILIAVIVAMHYPERLPLLHSLRQ